MALSLAAGKAGAASASTIDFSGGFLTSGPELSLGHNSGVGDPVLDGSKLKMTDGSHAEARSAFYVNKVNVAKFQTQFDFQMTNALADGLTFCVERNSRTPSGSGGSDLGYAGIPNSVAVKFDIFKPHTPDDNTTGLYTNGTAPLDEIPPGIDVKAASGIDFHSGHEIRVNLTYIEGTLSEEITDLTTSAVFMHEYSIDLPATIGESESNATAYVGFTAATGAETSVEELIDWTYTGEAEGVPDVLKYRADAADTGQYPTETKLSATNVNSASFGKLFTYTVDGAVYAQPLYKTAVPITSGTYKGTTHNVVFVATENDSLYAFDADGSPGTGPLWQISFINPAKGITPVPLADQASGDISPVGITSTPVIDPVTNTIFVCTKTKQVVSGTDYYFMTLHAVDISSGTPQTGSPTLIAEVIGPYPDTFVAGPRVTGAGSGSVNDKIYFDVLSENQRSALNLVNGTVYIPSSGNFGDAGNFHGWVIGVDALTYKITAVWNNTPDGFDGGIWQSGAGLVSDSNGDLYCLSGNGTFTQPTFDASTASYVHGDYGDTCVKLTVDYVHTSSANPNSNGWGLDVADYFTPSDQLTLAESDLDLGSGGCMIPPDSAGSAAHRHLLVAAGKEGTLYLLDTGTMGEFNSSGDRVVQEQASAFNNHPSFDTPAYYNGAFYYAAVSSNGNSFLLNSGSFTASNATPDTFGRPAASPIISGSSSNDPNAIVWCLDSGQSDSQLRAYKASNFNTELYTSDQAAAGRDAVGATSHFALPIVANGHVYVPQSTGLAVFGLLPVK